MQFKNILKDRVVQFLLFVILLNAIIFILLWRFDVFVNSELYNFGLIFDAAWTATYNPYIASTFALMVTSTLALIIPTIRTLGIIEIVKEH